MKSTMRMTINDRLLTCFSIAYLYLPLFVFFCMWTKWYIAALVMMASLYGCIVMIRDDAKNTSEGQSLHIDILPFAIISVCLLIVGMIAGWGGWMPQAWDWVKHNALLADLIQYDWPVYYKEAASPSMLTYYIGQYIIPALAGKLTGSFRVAEIMMYLWGEIGFFLIAFQLFKILNASTFYKQFGTIVILVVFSGCLILSRKLFQLFSGVTETDNHWMINTDGCQLQYRSNFVSLRWIMPQSLAVWLTITLWWTRRKSVGIYIPLMMPTLLFGALPFLGLAVMAIICAVYEAVLQKTSFKEFIRNVFSLPNILNLLATGIPLLLYFSGIVLSEKNPSVGFSVQHVGFWLYVIFCLGHFGLYALLSSKRHLKNGMFISAVILLLVLPFFRMGYYNDFVMSTSIPALFVIMICVMDTVFDKPKSLLAGALYLCLAIGALYPAKEMAFVVIHNNYTALDHDVSEPSLIRFSDLASWELSWKYNYFTYDVDNNLFIDYIAKTPYN